MSCPNEFKQRIGENIATIRERKGWGRYELSHRSGIKYETLSAIENGRTNATAGSLCGIANALGVKVDQLLGEQGE